VRQAVLAEASGFDFVEISDHYHPWLDSASAVKAAFESSRWSLTGWKVISELPNPAKFEASARFVREEDIAAQIPCGPDARSTSRPFARTSRPATTTSCSRTTAPIPDGFMDFFARALKPQLAA
jgi:hypothetical protein